MAMYPQAAVTKRFYAIIGIFLLAGFGLWAAMRSDVLTGQLVAADTFTATGPNGEKPNANGIIRLQKGDDITLEWNFPGKACVAGEGNNDWYYGEGQTKYTTANPTQGASGKVVLHNRQQIESFTLECDLRLTAFMPYPLISKTIILVFDDLDFTPPAPNTFEIIGSNGARMNADGVLTAPSGTDVIVQWNYPGKACVVSPPSPAALLSRDELTAGEMHEGYVYAGYSWQETVGLRVLRARTKNESYHIQCKEKNSGSSVYAADVTRSFVIGASVTTTGTTSGVGTAGAAVNTFTATGPNGEKPNANGIIRLKKGDDITLEWNFPGKKCVAASGNNDWRFGEGKDINTSGNLTQGESGKVVLHDRQKIESYTMECGDDHLFATMGKIPLISKTIILVFDGLDFAPPAPNTFEIIGANGARMTANGTLTVPSGTDVIVQWNYPDKMCVPQQPPSPDELWYMEEWTGSIQGAIYQESVGVRVLRARTQNESYRLKCDVDSTFMVLNKPTPIDETRRLVLGPAVFAGSSSSVAMGGGTSSAGVSSAGVRQGVSSGGAFSSEQLFAAAPTAPIQGPSVCTTVCGDGMVISPEQCDDGNAVDTDACSNTCAFNSSSSSSRLSSSSSSSSVAACIPGTLCPDGSICPQNGSCPAGSSSSVSSGLQACFPGALCPDGSICPENGFCPDWNASSSSGIDSCTVNADCPSNLCLGGYCSCTNAEQCGGNACVGGFCTNIPQTDSIALMACVSDRECPSGMLCQDGYCAPNFALCGNGIMDAGEVCDDGNGADNDSCTSQCLLADGMSCDNPRQCRSLICKDGVCTPCVSDNECPDDMACVEGVCSAFNPLDPDNDGMVVLSDGYKIAASLFSQLDTDVLPENLSYEQYVMLMQQHAAGHAPVGNTGPESIAVVAAGASAGYAWMKMRRLKKK